MSEKRKVVQLDADNKYAEFRKHSGKFDHGKLSSSNSAYLMRYVHAIP